MVELSSSLATGEDLSFLPYNPLHRAKFFSYKQAASPEQVIQKGENNQSGAFCIFYNLILEVTYHHFFCILLITKINPGTM